MSSHWKKEMRFISDGHTLGRGDDWQNDDSTFHGHSNMGRQAIKKTHAHAEYGRGRDDGFATGANAHHHVVADYSNGMSMQGRSSKRRSGM
jgi:hypothetical protein